MQILNNDEAAEIMSSVIQEQAIPGVSLQILEAGCGQQWWLDLKRIPYILTGLDLDRHALEIRKNVVNDLHEIIEGDLRSARLPESKFDVIYCAYVLEHVQGSSVVLENFIKWLKPGGLAIIQVPNPYSVNGFITSHTPHAFHVWVHRHVFGNPNAGKPGYVPYPTFYSDVLSEKGMYKFCERIGFEVLHFYRVKPWYGGALRRSILNAFTLTVGALSLGYLDGSSSNLLCILRKKDTEHFDNKNLDEAVNLASDGVSKASINGSSSLPV